VRKTTSAAAAKDRVAPRTRKPAPRDEEQGTPETGSAATLAPEQAPSQERPTPKGEQPAQDGTGAPASAVAEEPTEAGRNPVTRQNAEAAPPVGERVPAPQGEDAATQLSAFLSRIEPDQLAQLVAAQTGTAPRTNTGTDVPAPPAASAPTTASAVMDKATRNRLRHHVRSAAGKFAQAKADMEMARQEWTQECATARNQGFPYLLIQAQAVDAGLEETDIPADPAT